MNLAWIALYNIRGYGIDRIRIPLVGAVAFFAVSCALSKTVESENRDATIRFDAASESPHPAADDAKPRRDAGLDRPRNDATPVFDSAYDGNERIDASDIDAVVVERDAYTCDFSRCTVPEVPLPYFVDDPIPYACCTDSNHSCGYSIDNDFVTMFLGTNCVEIVPGVVDDTCLDTMVDGVIVEGCRREDGRCGHVAGPYGCYLLLRPNWESKIDESDVSNPFNCAEELEPCLTDADCCMSLTHTILCIPDNDAGDAGGICVDMG
jgi:hypothetical protein